MGDIVNLNRFRKQQERRRKEDEAAENRVRFGRTKAERAQDRGEEDRRNRDLDGKKRGD